MIPDVRRAAVGVGLLAAVATPTVARAVDLHNVLTGYALSSWTEGDGRSLGAVSAIAQDLSGYLWLGTDIGLVRFDGWRFTRWETISRVPLPRSPIAALSAARDDTLWIGFADGSVLRVKDGEVLEPGAVRGDGGPVAHLSEDHTGAIWAVTGGTVRRFRGGRWETIVLEKGSPAPTAVMVHAIGAHVWIGSRYGLHKWIEESDTFQKILNLGAVDVAEDASQHLWITDFSQGFRSVTGATRTGGLQGTGLRLLSDRRGNLWVATIGEGLWRVQVDGREQPTVEKASLDTGLLSDSIQAITEDREGNIWIGTTGGLQRLTERTFTPVANIGWVTALDAGVSTVWAGTSNGLFRLDSGSDRWRRQPKQPVELWVRSVHVDRRGTLWVGSDRMLFTMIGDRLEPVPFSPRVSFGPIDCLTSDSFGNIWFSDGPRLFRWQHGHLAQVDIPIQTGEAQIVSLYADSFDRLWVAFKEGRLDVLESATGQPVAGIHADALHQTIYDIFEDTSRIIWLLGSRGLTKFSQGRFVTLAPEPRVLSSVLGAIVGDDDDELWLNTDSGLLRLRRKAFEAAVDDPTRPLQYQLYDTADGVAGAPIVKLVARRDANGRLWFARGGALTSVTPMRLADGLPPVPQFVRIEGVVTDDGAVHDLSKSVLAASTRRVAINYTALALTAPSKIRFRYRLDGFDADWVDAGTGRQAFYTNLAPGEYVFRVEASASDGRWQNSSATWRFRREPRLVQTRAFYIGLAALLGLCAVGVWKLRIRMVHREFAAVLAERLRLSREIHDTLLQNLVGLALQFDVLAEGLDALTADARYRLVRVRKQVEGYVREARQSIYELRSPSPPSCPDLARSLTEFGAQTAGGTLAFESRVEGDPPEYSAKLRRALIRIGQEAITNTVRHADARRIQLDIRFEAGAIALRVADDGCGFDVDRVQAEADDHYGLISMRERAEDIRAHLDIVSEKGRGTVVTLRAPLLDD